MMKNMFLRPLAFLVLAVLLDGCKKEELSLQPADLQAESQAASTTETGCDVIDFERVAEYPRDGNKFVTGVLSQNGLPVKVSALSRRSSGSWETQNRANIANSADPGDWDRDLKTPNWNLSTPALGNVLIAQELVLAPTDASTPNDNAHGAQLEIDFSGSGPVTVNSMHVVDVDPYETTGKVVFYDASNNPINVVDVPVTGDNGVEKMVFTGARGVMKMVVTLDGLYPSSNTVAGSGAIDNISFCKETTPPPPPPAECGTCEGKVSRMTLQYNGPESGVYIQPSIKNGSKASGLSLIGPLQPGELFTLDGTQNPDGRGGFSGTLGTDVILKRLAGDKKTVLSATQIHTSCSQPIFESYGNNLYTTMEAYSKTGGRICNFAPVSK